MRHPAMTEQNFDQLRKAMVESQLRTTAVNDPRVVEAMAAVPRERFVAADAGFMAYLDRDVPLGQGRAMPAPMVLGRLLTEARTRATDKALVIGSGSGYAAAVVGRLVATVVALEEDGTLAAIGQANIGANVMPASGPLAAGWAVAAPYDLILFDGAVEEIPAAIVAQLADNGRLAAPVVIDGVVRLAIGRKAGAGFGLTSIVEANCPRLPGFAKPSGFRF
jgi:protein-L-isoaspartate(D-aspartate) O-methyltransferase